ncbi:hypothetical protein D3C71_1456620 [compost metagenome]
MASSTSALRPRPVAKYKVAGWNTMPESASPYWAAWKLPNRWLAITASASPFCTNSKASVSVDASISSTAMPKLSIMLWKVARCTEPLSTATRLPARSNIDWMELPRAR